MSLSFVPNDPPIPILSQITKLFFKKFLINSRLLQPSKPMWRPIWAAAVSYLACLSASEAWFRSARWNLFSPRSPASSRASRIHCVGKESNFVSGFHLLYGSACGEEKFLRADASASTERPNLCPIWKRDGLPGIELLWSPVTTGVFTLCPTVVQAYVNLGEWCCFFGGLCFTLDVSKKEEKVLQKCESETDNGGYDSCLYRDAGMVDDWSPKPLEEMSFIFLIKTVYWLDVI